jgi:hypothetical protein
LEVVLGNGNEPFAQSSALGWSIVGNTTTNEVDNTLLNVPSNLKSDMEEAEEGIVHRTIVKELNHRDTKSISTRF